MKTAVLCDKCGEVVPSRNTEEAKKYDRVFCTKCLDPAASKICEGLHEVAKMCGTENVKPFVDSLVIAVAAASVSNLEALEKSPWCGDAKPVLRLISFVTEPVKDCAELA